MVRGGATRQPIVPLVRCRIVHMKTSEQIRLLKSSKQVHSNWYRETYPEVAELNMDPAHHYLRYGADMGRNPGKSFDTNFYLSTYPEVAESGMNPLLHYVLHGKAKGYSTKPAKSPGAKHVSTVRTKLLSLGFTDRPLQELADIQTNAKVPATRALAARELALWHMRAKTSEGYSAALEHLRAARAENPELSFRRKLSVAELLCHYFLGDLESARACYERASLSGEISPDLLLAKANLEATPEARIRLMNRVLGYYQIAPIALLPDENLAPYDRLTLAETIHPVTEGPTVTVLIAAYDAADTLPTALRSLQEQTWQNLEILVIDDCSPEMTTVEVAQDFAKRDPRIRVIQMEKNAGAYVARNRGLDEATGEYVTLHDADDWSHPRKIETQVRFMQENPDVVGCTTQQARVRSDLSFTRWTGSGSFIITNTSSFMFRRKQVRDTLGYWDTVRFGADMELIRRIRAVWGKEAVFNIKDAIYSFQRDSETSVVADEALGATTMPFGVRRQYVETQLQHHEDLARIKYNNNLNERPFCVPQSMIKSKSDLKKPQHYDVIIASDFRMLGGSTVSNSQEILAQKKAGLRTAIFPMFRYDFGRFERPILPEVWNLVDGESVDVLAYGQQATCDLLILRYPPILYHKQKYIPEIKAKEIKVIVNQPPMSDYGSEGVVRYDIGKCAENIRYYFGKEATWHPIGPLIRDALHRHHSEDLRHIHLSDDDWSNIIDIDGWYEPNRRHEPTGPLRIGRHSRDHEHKWPNNPKDILAAYPAADDIHVSILGGAEAAKALIGDIPDNWTVHSFGSIHPREFLKSIDVWIYFSHPDWLESFGRTIIEAMAAGVPVILPSEYKPLFHDAAIYATPQDAIEVARDLFSDTVAYNNQVTRAHAYVKNKFSFEMHIDRVGKYASSRFEKVSNVEESTVVAERPKIDIPKSSGKTSITALSEMPVIHLSTSMRPSSRKSALLKQTIEGHQYDYLWSPKEKADRLFVLFSGDAQRKQNNPPVFQRWSWAPSFSGHCLYVSDPMLHMNPDMGLAWYAGTEDHDPMERIIHQVRDMLSLLQLEPKDVCAYGSSGGGFAAIRMSAMFPGISAIAINPQINIANYEKSSPDRYARVCLKREDRYKALADFPLRMDLLQHVKALKQQRLIVIQNTLDTHHYDEHYKPFCSAMGANSKQNLDEGNFRRVLFSDERGHGKAETPEAFGAAMHILENDFSHMHAVNV